MDGNYDTPPPYSDAEFDKKLSLVLEASLSPSSDLSQQLHVEEEWETWDESKFQLAALARERDEMDSHAQVAGTSHQIVSGMALEQRYGGDRGITGTTKDGGIPGTKDGSIPGTTQDTQVPPSLKAAMGTTHSPVNSSDICSEPPPVPNPPRDPSLQEESSVSYIDDESAPPPFSPYDTSLDGPPFEEVVSEGSAPSYLHDGFASSTSATTAPQIMSSERFSANSTRPIIPLTVQPPRFDQRSTSRINRVPVPRVDFNASMAYHGLSSSSYPYPTAAAVDASAFYNSSVSAYMRPQVTRYLGDGSDTRSIMSSRSDSSTLTVSESYNGRSERISSRWSTYSTDSSASFTSYRSTDTRR